MRLRASFLLLALVSCASNPEVEIAQRQSNAASTGGRDRAREMVAGHVVMSGASSLREASPMTGIIQVGDDQASNSHDVTVQIGTMTGRPCREVVDVEDGLRCALVQSCDPIGPDKPIEPIEGDDDGEPPPDDPQAVDIGEIVVSAPFDTLRIPFADYGYPYTFRTGPFWSGDGDWITISGEGKAGVAPPFTHRLLAPVTDVVTRLPSSVDRNDSLVIDWRYAEGPGKASGYVTLRMTQFGSADVSIMCGAPAAKRSMRIPPSILTRFEPGPTYLSVTSMTDEERVVVGDVDLLVKATSYVDVMSDDEKGGVVDFR